MTQDELADKLVICAKKDLADALHNIERPEIAASRAEHAATLLRAAGLLYAYSYDEVRT